MEQDVAPTGFYDHLPRMTRTIRRNAFTRKTGTKVRARMIRDVGAPGKWRAEHMGAPGIGKMKEGLLKAVGYDVNAKATRRRAAVKRAVKKYGRSSTIKKLNAVAVYTRRTSPAKSKKFKADMRAAQKMKGGAEEENLNDVRWDLHDRWSNSTLTKDEAASLLARTKALLPDAKYTDPRLTLDPFDADAFYHGLDEVIENPTGKK